MISNDIFYEIERGKIVVLCPCGLRVKIDELNQPQKCDGCPRSYFVKEIESPIGAEADHCGKWDETMTITLHGSPFDLKEIEVPYALTEYIVPIEPTIDQLVTLKKDDDPYLAKRAIYYRIGSTLDYRFSSILPWM